MMGIMRVSFILLSTFLQFIEDCHSFSLLATYFIFFYQRALTDVDLIRPPIGISIRLPAVECIDPNITYSPTFESGDRNHLYFDAYQDGSHRPFH